MKKYYLTVFLLLAASLSIEARNVNINARGREATAVFEDIMRQTGKNFIYKAGLLKGMKITVHASDEPLESVLRRMFADTGITFSIKGDNVILQRVKSAAPRARQFPVSGRVTENGTSEPLVGALVALEGTSDGVFTNSSGFFSIRLPEGKGILRVSYPGYVARSVNVTVPSSRNVDVSLSTDTIEGRLLSEVVVTSDINHTISMCSADVGRLSLNVSDIKNTPVLFGENDVVKALQMQPGVSHGIEGMAGMYVHGGAADENLVLLDGVPLYQANHFGGLFSAFNVDVIKNVDFYKSSFPAVYGGRLSSVLDVHTKDGSSSGHHGSLRIGLTSGAFNIDGPVAKNTTYSFAVRRSWYEILTVPGLALYNHFRQENVHTRNELDLYEVNALARYAFMDVNAKLTHNFSDGGRLYGMFYYGDDYLKGGEKRQEMTIEQDASHVSSNIVRLHWGNILGSVGYDRPFSSSLFGEFSFSVSHFSSSIRRDNEVYDNNLLTGNVEYSNTRTFKGTNRMTDLIARASFLWNASQAQRVDFGAEYTRHFFRPQDEVTEVSTGGEFSSSGLLFDRMGVDEVALYISDDWDISSPLRLSAGLRGNLYSGAGLTHLSIDPRLGVRWALRDDWSLKFSYSAMTQYVHQLSESFLSLPTDLWVPLAGEMRPQRSHNLSVGAYHSFGNGYTAGLEIYRRWLRNVVDYPDFYYLAPKGTPWYELLTSGEGRVRGLDFSVSKSFGRISGHFAYSLLWADRRFDSKNDGQWFPDRFDNRHKFNIVVNWKINDKWDVNLAWTGMSGNRYTLQTQNYEVLSDPDIPFIDGEWSGSIDMVSEINGRRLPFYHRLDLGARLRTRHGEWNFSLYNAYCNMNVIAVRKQYWANARPEFRYLRLLPAIPGVSYTWFF